MFTESGVLAVHVATWLHTLCELRLCFYFAVLHVLNLTKLQDQTNVIMDKSMRGSGGGADLVTVATQ